MPNMSGQVYAIGALYLLPCSALAVPRRGFGQGPILACLGPCHSAKLSFQRACWAHFAWSQVGILHWSNCCTSASVARLPVGLVLVWVHYQLQLLVAQVIFVTAGTSRGFNARREVELKEGQGCMVLSQRHRASTAMTCIAELSLAVGWALMAAASFCLAIANSCHRCEEDSNLRRKIPFDF